mgnify:CR=1 FL=1
MPDERRDSIEQGIGAPDESPIGRTARTKRAEEAGDAPPMDSAMGGTSDADSPGDEAQQKALEHARNQDEPTEGDPR